MRYGLTYFVDSFVLKKCSSNSHRGDSLSVMIKAMKVLLPNHIFSLVAKLPASLVSLEARDRPLLVRKKKRPRKIRQVSWRYNNPKKRIFWFFNKKKGQQVLLARQKFFLPKF